jgi:hypothetical protein
VKVEDIPFESYIRKPFDVAAIQITDDNIEELSKFIGTLEMQENGRYVINVDRKLIRNLDKVYSGYWLTKMGTTLRCYSQNAFAKHFVAVDDNPIPISVHDHTHAIANDTWPAENPHVVVTYPDTEVFASNVNPAPPLVTWNVSTGSAWVDPPEPEEPLQSQDIFD